MRTKKELLQICLKHFDKHFETSLCLYVHILKREKIITRDEQWLLEELFEANRPRRKKILGVMYPAYWWPEGNERLRLNFLNKLLKKYSDEK
jgi:hypothetical protein